MPSAPTDPASLDRSGAVWEMIRIATPTVATMVSYTTMQFVDGLMVSRISPADPDNVSAQGNGNVWSFVPLSIMMGLVSVVNTYVSQNLGAGTPRRGPAYAWNAIWTGVIAWLVVIIPFALALPLVFSRMGHSKHLYELETHYAQILLFGGVLTIASRALNQFFFGMHRPLVVFIAAVAGNVVNLGVNWVLVYGNFGVPAMGVTGAAVGTLIGSAVEFLIPLTLFLSPSFHRLYGTRSAWRLSLPHVRDILRLGWPAAMMFGNEIICWAVFMAGFQGRFGPEQNSAGWIALRYMHLSFMPAVGLSFACTAVVGRCLGAGRPDLAAQRARIGVTVAMVYMGLCALAFVLFRRPLVALFIPADMSAQQAALTIEVGSQIMIVAAIFQVFDAMGITLIGVLRGAGDTVWPGVATMVLAWSILLGLGAILTFSRPDLGALGPWIAAGVYIIALGLALVWRFRTGKWKSMKVLDQNEAGDLQVQEAAAATASA